MKEEKGGVEDGFEHEAKSFFLRLFMSYRKIRLSDIVEFYRFVFWTNVFNNGIFQHLIIMV